MKPKDLWLSASCIFVSLLAGFVGSIFTTPNIESWYQNIIKPQITPSDTIFGPIWTLLYIFMGISIFFIIRNGFKNKDIKLLSIIFLLQLILNFLWSIIFFELNLLLFASIEILILFSLIFFYIIKSYKINKFASIIMIPYFLWVGFASYLTITIFILN